MSTDNDWQRSSFCSNGTCVEVGRDGDLILIRDSKNPSQQPLAFSVAEWQAFVAGVEAGQFRDL